MLLTKWPECGEQDKVHEATLQQNLSRYADKRDSPKPHGRLIVPHPDDPAFERAHEYIDSPRMTQRLVHGKQLSAQIDGNFGIYRTHVRLVRSKEAGCTCPSDLWPCKHVHALRATWETSPESFFDLGQFLKGLAAKPKAELIDALRRVLIAYPESLSVLGVPGFEPSGDPVDDE